jgi:hypothetical protein
LSGKRAATGNYAKLSHLARLLADI